jgi:hypothetical protein
VTYTALLVAFLVVGVAVGAVARDRAERPILAAILAAVMVVAQFLLLLSP